MVETPNTHIKKGVLKAPCNFSWLARPAAFRARSKPDFLRSPTHPTAFSATGIGKAHMPVLLAALASGRTASAWAEDNVTMERGRARHQRILVRRRRADRHAGSGKSRCRRECLIYKA